MTQQIPSTSHAQPPPAGGPPVSLHSMSDSELTELARVAKKQGLQLGLHVHEAEDLSQLVLLEFLTATNPVRQPGAWVRQVARRKSWQLRLKRIPLEGDTPVEVSVAPLVTERIDLSRALSRLSPQELQVWFERRVMRRTIAELVEDGEMSASTVKRRLEKATTRVRRCLKS